jgi:hypothetical protein
MALIDDDTQIMRQPSSLFDLETIKQLLTQKTTSNALSKSPDKKPKSPFSGLLAYKMTCMTCNYVVSC